MLNFTENKRLTTSNNNTMKQDIKPLWQRLNEERTQGEWLYQLTSMHKMQDAKYSISEKSTPIKEIASFLTNRNLYDLRSDEVRYDVGVTKANAQYTALAVNNLASLAESLEGFIHWWDNSGQPDECRNNAMRAKESLNKIS